MTDVPATASETAPSGPALEPAEGPDPARPEAGGGRRPDRPRSANLGGRPTLYTAPRVLAIISGLFDGLTRAEAARRAGVGPSTFYGWLQLGRAGHPSYAPLAKAVASAEGSRVFGRVLGGLMRQRGFWKALP